MRITAPLPNARMRLDDIQLADTALYTSGDAHLAWQTLRAESPVCRQDMPGREPFWSVTRYPDVRRVLSEHESFTSECGTAISMLGTADLSAGKMMHATDPPRHRQFREVIGQPLSPGSLPAYAKVIRDHVRTMLEEARERDVWDAAGAVTRLPMAVATKVLGLPVADIELLLRLTYSSLAPDDVSYSDNPDALTAYIANLEIMDYFAQFIAERRRSPGQDLISTLVSATIDGRQMTDEELLLNCLSLLLGSVVTTSQAVSAMLIAVLQMHGGVGRWPATTPVVTAVEEALRWSSPVTHFMRRARRDVEIRGQAIRTGEPVAAWIASANRDEAVFDQPYKLDFERTPNRHITFGAGPHRCIGMHLARMMLRVTFAELFARVESFELVGPPRHLVSNGIAGVVRLDLRVRMRPER